MAILPDKPGHPGLRLRAAGGALLDALLAPRCVLCGAGSGGPPLCPSCAADLPRLPEACCPGCALPTPGGLRCGACLRAPPHFDRTHALYRYDFPVDALIHALKYGHQLALATFLGEQIAERLPGGERVDLVLPLPLHAGRLRQRGFNQALELARPLGRRLNIPLAPGICQRVRPTAPQATLPWKERAANLHNAFAVTDDLRGRHILLVDDVMTTGATLNECARTLKLHGAERVTLAVVARALRA